MRLRYGYFITCTGVVKDAAGKPIELRCTYDPATRGGNAPDGRKVKSTIHWVSAAARHRRGGSRLYETLFTKENPNDLEEGQEFTDLLNPQFAGSGAGLQTGAELGRRAPGVSYQFERLGYFCVDTDSTPAASGV